MNSHSQGHDRFKETYPNTQGALLGVERLVRDAVSKDLESRHLLEELKRLQDALREVLGAPDFLSVRGVDAPETTVLLQTFESAPHLRAHHTAILVAVVMDFVNRVRVVLAQAEEPKVIYARASALRSVEQSTRVDQYHNVLAAVWAELGILDNPKKLQDMVSLTRPQKFALRYIVFARIAQAELGDHTSATVLKEKIRTLILQDRDVYNQAIRLFFPKMQPSSAVTLHSSALRHIKSNPDLVWEKLGPHLTEIPENPRE